MDEALRAHAAEAQIGRAPDTLQAEQPRPVSPPSGPERRKSDWDDFFEDRGASRAAEPVSDETEDDFDYIRQASRRTEAPRARPVPANNRADEVSNNERRFRDFVTGGSDPRNKRRDRGGS
jgi:hypothetical protein